jgi:hypothetical protein
MCASAGAAGAGGRLQRLQPLIQLEESSLHRSAHGIAWRQRAVAKLPRELGAQLTSALLRHIRARVRIKEREEGLFGARGACS